MQNFTIQSDEMKKTKSMMSLTHLPKVHSFQSTIKDLGLNF